MGPKISNLYAGIVQTMFFPIDTASSLDFFNEAMIFEVLRFKPRV